MVDSKPLRPFLGLLYLFSKKDAVVVTRLYMGVWRKARLTYISTNELTDWIDGDQVPKNEDDDETYYNIKPPRNILKT